MLPHDPLWRLAKARRLSTERLLKSLSIVRPPVDVHDLARRLQVRLEPTPGLEWSGDVRVEGGRAYIRFNADESHLRQRFTVAHELGHLMLHPEGEYRRDTSFYGDEYEAQANGYAAGILMPIWMLEPLLAGGAPSVADLAQRFDVSSAAMAIRVRRLLAGATEVWGGTAWK